MNISGGIRRGTRRKALTLTIVGLAVGLTALLASQASNLVKAAHVLEERGIEGVTVKLKSRQWMPGLFIDSMVEFPTARPEDYGIDGPALQGLTRNLAEHETRAFLVVKDGHIVHEWYAPGDTADTKLSMAALAKPVTGSVALAAAIDGGWISLEDPAWKYIPHWREDPQKSKITIGQLASHRSGLEDVEFEADVSPAWKLEYYQNSDVRFPRALNTASVMFEPGTDTMYSGVGYYALAYALARSLEQAPEADVRKFLTKSIMEPLEIPSGAWTMSYAEFYELDGLKLYAVGSGSRYSARAVARVGQLMLNRGEWNGKRLLDSGLVDATLTYTSPPTRAGETSYSLGWQVNSANQAPSLPADAFWGSGKGEQFLLVVPSLDLIVVRMGGALEPGPYERDLQMEQLEMHLLQPLMEIIR